MSDQVFKLEQKKEICERKLGGCGNTNSTWSCNCSLDSNGFLFQKIICDKKLGGCGNTNSTWCCNCTLETLKIK